VIGDPPSRACTDYAPRIAIGTGGVDVNTVWAGSVWSEFATRGGLPGRLATFVRRLVVCSDTNLLHSDPNAALMAAVVLAGVGHP